MPNNTNNAFAGTSYDADKYTFERGLSGALIRTSRNAKSTFERKADEFAAKIEAAHAAAAARKAAFAAILEKAGRLV